MINEQDEQALEAGRVAWWTMDLPSGDITFKPIKAIQLGYDPKDFTHYKHFIDLVHPDDYEQAMQKMRDYIQGKTKRYQCKYRIKDADGNYHVYVDQGVIRERHGENISLFGATIDVTDMEIE